MRRNKALQVIQHLVRWHDPELEEIRRVFAQGPNVFVAQPLPADEPLTFKVRDYPSHP